MAAFAPGSIHVSQPCWKSHGQQGIPLKLKDAGAAAHCCLGGPFPPHRRADQGCIQPQFGSAPQLAMPRLPCPVLAWISPSDPCAARYQLAVTRRKEEEPTSTSIYNQNDPWSPTVTFADFINNETITNQVSWGPWDGEKLSLVRAVPAPALHRGFTHSRARLSSCWAGRVLLSLTDASFLFSAGLGCLDHCGVPARPSC